MTDGAGNLAQQIQEQTLKSARGFYGDSLGALKGQLEDDRSQLQELLDQLPDSQQETRDRLEEMVESYEARGNFLDEVAQHQGVQDAVEGTAQQAQETVGQATEGEFRTSRETQTDRYKTSRGRPASRHTMAPGRRPTGQERWSRKRRN